MRHYQNTNNSKLGGGSGGGEEGWLFPAGIFSGSLAVPTLGSSWQEWIRQPSKSKWTALASTVLLKRLKQVVMSKASQLNAIVRGRCLDWRKLGKWRLSTLLRPSSVISSRLVQVVCPHPGLEETFSAGIMPTEVHSRKVGGKPTRAKPRARFPHETHSIGVTLLHKSLRKGLLLAIRTNSLTGTMVCCGIPSNYSHQARNSW